MKIESFAIRLRQRSSMEATDLGVRMCQNAARSVFGCYWSVAVPFVALSLAAFYIAPWISSFALWMGKPWLDRTILFALARAALGQSTSPLTVWKARREVWLRQLLLTCTVQRLSAWRSFTQPIYQLEGLGGATLRRRVAQLRFGNTRAATLVLSIFAAAESVLFLSLLSLGFWLAPKGYAPDFSRLISGASLSTGVDLVLFGTYALAVLFLEPFYVASGFAMYLSRRVDLEAWDIEQEFRRAFAV